MSEPTQSVMDFQGDAKLMKIDTLMSPLAARLRPRSLKHCYGQAHLLAEGKVLSTCVAEGKLHSMVLWGPPGTGKTTLAHVLANAINAEVRALSAVTSGVKDIKEVMAEAAMRQKMAKRTVLFIDEVHRFSKSQQDAFLPFIEEGVVTFIGATTENPSFELNNALLSRVKVHVLKPLNDNDLAKILAHALSDKPHGLGKINLTFTKEDQQLLIDSAHGDARTLLNSLEALVDYAKAENGVKIIDIKAMQGVLGENIAQCDKHKDHFHDLISALHKSIRGSDPDAALYWLCRMLEGGVDPLYLARRLVRVASEDIGNADPRALSLTLNAWDVQERLGHPEGELALAQAVLYLSVAPKSNAVYKAFNQAMEFTKANSNKPVPMHLRNAPTKLMKSLGASKGYIYPHNEPNAYVKGEQYFPDGLSENFYEPTERGLEKKIQKKLRGLRG